MNEKVEEIKGKIELNKEEKDMMKDGMEQEEKKEEAPSEGEAQKE